MTATAPSSRKHVASTSGRSIGRFPIFEWEAAGRCYRGRLEAMTANVAGSTEGRLARPAEDAEDRAEACFWGARTYRYLYLRWSRRAQLLLAGSAGASFLATAALLGNLAKTDRTFALMLGGRTLLAGPRPHAPKRKLCWPHWRCRKRVHLVARPPRPWRLRRTERIP
jgi:hypothetical protein